MANKRRARTDSIKGAKEIFEGAQILLDPPLGVELGHGVRPYWDKLVRAKATRAWQQQDLIMLVELSRNLYRTEKLSREILNEDEVIDGKANPKSGIIDQLVKRARMIMAMLQIHPEATQGKSKDQVKQNSDHLRAMESSSDSSDDVLLPGLH